jgi:Rrf2 family protein
MRISVKGRYALAAAVVIAQESVRGINVSVSSIAENLGISKIYLEQVFSQLKKANLLTSVKGPRGGYRLAKTPSRTTVWEVLVALELSLTEKPEDTVGENAPGVEAAMRRLIFEPLDVSIREALCNVTVQDMMDDAETNNPAHSFMLNM